jgi:hypothetical protein
LSWFINAGLLGLVWWCAHRLTWDCTNLDEDSDVNAEGLLQAAGLENENKTDNATEAEEKPAQPEGWLQRWRRYQDERKKKRTLGVWVIYFSLAALPLFGLGQALIDAADVERRRASFWLMIVYVGCGLGLLLTTCFLALRRYLRQRKLQMPVAMTGVWLTVGGTFIAVLLGIGAVLPRPDAEYSLFNLTPAKSAKRNASKYSFKGDKPGEDQGQGGRGGEGADDKSKGSGSGGKDGKQKGENGDPSKQGKDGSGGKDGKSGKDGKDGDKQSDKNGSQSGKDKQNANKDNPRSSQEQPAGKDKSKYQKNNKDSSSSGNRQQQANQKPPEHAKSDSSAPKSSNVLRNFLSRLGPILKWIVFAILALVVLFFVLRSGLQFLANFSDWARRLLESLRNFWANLFGGWKRARQEDEENEPEERAIPERPFASFHNPFDGGPSRMATPELIRYTFAAVQAWARERDLGRQSGETVQEFAKRVGQEVPALETDLHNLALLYARAVYSRGGLPGNSVEVLRQFWQRLETVAEQPLSA